MPMMVTHHPTFAFFHSPYEWGAFDVDMQRFGRLVRGQLRAPEKLLTPPTRLQLKTFHKLLLDSGEPVSVDIETRPAAWDTAGYTGKQPRYARLNLLGLGTEELGLSFRVGERPDLVLLAKAILEDDRIPKVFQNGLWFDLPILHREGFEVHGDVFDTRDARRALVSTSPLSLEYLASLYDDTNAWKKDKDFDNLVYNAKDCVRTSRSWKGLEGEEDWNTPHVQAIYEQQMELSRICSEMHLHGFKVDPVMREWMAQALLQEFEEKLLKLKAAVGVPGFNGTPNDMRAIIFKRHEKGGLQKFSLPDPVDPLMYTDPKRLETVSVDFDSLVLLLVDPSTPEELRHIIDLYWDAAGVQKRRSTFIVSKLVDQAIGPDGRLRAGWNSCGTDTGRFSCSEPNVMNIEQELRAYLVAGKGRKLVHADKSQLELRVMEAVANDKVLKQFLDRGDVYTEDCKAFFGLPEGFTKKEVKPEARKTAKGIHLGSQYGAGVKTVHRLILSENRKQKFSTTMMLHNRFKQVYADTCRYWLTEMELVLRQGYSASRIMDRRRYYPAPPELSEVANYPIQATAADIMNEELILVDAQLKRNFPGAFLVAQLHDAVDVDCSERQAGAVERMLQDVMNRPRVVCGHERSFPVETKVGDRWSEV